VEAADSCAQHELNNSLRRSSPSPTAACPHHPRAAPSDQREDLRKGLGLIASRSESLSRLMVPTRASRLPPPGSSPWRARMDPARRGAGNAPRSLRTSRT